MKALNAGKLYPFERFILDYVIFASIKKKKNQFNTFHLGWA